MTAFTHENTRTIKLMGSLGEIRGHMEKNTLEVYRFGNTEPEIINLNIKDYGHSGGDYGIMKAFCSLIEKDDLTELTSNKASIESHLLAFAAENARITKQTIDFKNYIKGLKL
jgi:hypothetical protein